MSYFKINNVDYSKYVNELKIKKSSNYNAQTNASGNTVVDYINSKRQIEVGIIPLDDAAMKSLQTALAGFSVSISFLNPQSSKLEKINCIIPETNVEYYTIRAERTLFNAFTLKFIEL